MISKGAQCIRDEGANSSRHNEVVGQAEIPSSKMTSDSVPVNFIGSSSRFRGVLLPTSGAWIYHKLLYMTVNRT
jgi:hypothetical protein